MKPRYLVRIAGAGLLLSAAVAVSPMGRSVASATVREAAADPAPAQYVVQAPSTPVMEEKIAQWDPRHDVFCVTFSPVPADDRLVIQYVGMRTRMPRGGHLASLWLTGLNQEPQVFLSVAPPGSDGFTTWGQAVTAYIEAGSSPVVCAVRATGPTPSQDFSATITGYLVDDQQ